MSSWTGAGRRESRRAAFLLALLFAALVGGGCSLAERAAARRTGSRLQDVPAPAPVPPQSPSPLPEVSPVRPVLRAGFPETAGPDAVEVARTTPGVAAAGRLALTSASAGGAEGPVEITLAAVEPLEFRPLAPRSTAAAEFVWRGLLRGEIFLAHDDHGRLGVPLGAPIALRGPGGETRARLGGLAANGVPNLAGGVVSLDVARRMGLGEPSLLLVGVGAGEQVEAVRRSLQERLPEAAVEPTDPLTGKAFLTGAAAAGAFGSFTFTVNPDGSINPDRTWVRRNIVTRRVPVLGQVTCHRLMFPQLEGALGELERSGLAHLIDVADYRRRGGDCYQPRFVDSDPRRSLSRHAWGIAIDINKTANPEGRPSRQDPRLVTTFERWGFRWGGYWRPTDPMHFELAALLKR